MRKGDWFQTFTGVEFWPLDPRPEDIVLEDIAHGLSHICRFGGHTRTFYCVGDHALHVTDCIKQLGGTVLEQFIGLHHDDTEAYVGDVVRPMKRQPEFDFYRHNEDVLARAIFKSFGLKEDVFPFPDIIKYADNALLYTEARDMMPEHCWKKNSNLPDCYLKNDTLLPRKPEVCKRLFIEKHFELLEQLNG